MNARRSVAIVLLLTFPAPAFAQAPAHPLDLSSLKHVDSEQEHKPFTLSFSSARPSGFQQAVAITPCDDAAARGRAAADKRRFSHPWFWSSVGVNTFVPFLGMLGMVTAASAVNTKPKVIPADVDQNCFKAGYAAGSRKDNMMTALWGSLLGTGIWIVRINNRD